MLKLSNHVCTTDTSIASVLSLLNNYHEDKKRRYRKLQQTACGILLKKLVYSFISSCSMSSISNLQINQDYLENRGTNQNCCTLEWELRYLERVSKMFCNFSSSPSTENALSVNSSVAPVFKTRFFTSSRESVLVSTVKVLILEYGHYLKRRLLKTDAVCANKLVLFVGFELFQTIVMVET